MSPSIKSSKTQWIVFLPPICPQILILLWLAKLLLVIGEFFSPKWIRQAWRETSAKLKETVVNAFVKHGITLHIGGSRDGEIHLEGIPDYKVGTSFSTWKEYQTTKLAHPRMLRMHFFYDSDDSDFEIDDKVQTMTKANLYKCCLKFLNLYNYW